MQVANPTAVDDHLSDAQIAQRISVHDSEALRQLMRRYNQILYRTARSILKDDAEAEEAVQDAFLHAYQSIGSFRGDAKLSTWLVRIVANEALGRLRKRVRRAEVIRLDDSQQQNGDVSVLDAETNMPQTDVEQPENAAMRAEVRHLIERKIDQLPDAFRTVFVLRTLEEMSVEETAACLDIPQSTVRTRYFRAKGLLRESLAREIDFNFENSFGCAGARCDRIVTNVFSRLRELQARDA